MNQLNKPSNMNKDKFKPQYSSVYDKFKDYHTTEGYELKYIDEIYLPFWICKQEIYIQKGIKPDEFSKILLSLVEQGIKKHHEICLFLGVKEDDFCLSQLDYLLNNDFLEENIIENESTYEITFEGRNFLAEDKDNPIDRIERTEIEYSVSALDCITNEKVKNFYSDLTKEYFDERTTFDSVKNNSFSGYKLIETHKLQKDNKYPKECIPHKNKPKFNNINKSDFIEFYNHKNDSVFYDFGPPKIEAHKRSIKFYMLLFQKDENSKIVEIRHCKDSVLKFDKTRLSLEEKLSASVEQFIRQDISFIENLMPKNNTSK